MHVMKKCLPGIIFLLCGFSFSAYAQFGLPPGFDIKAFKQQEDLALWMLQYDSAQYRIHQFDTSTVRETQICIPAKDNGWKVYSGKLDSNGLSRVHLFLISGKGKIERQTKTTDTTLSDAMARALYNARLELSKMNYTSAWRNFIRTNLDNSITVWAFPDNTNCTSTFYGPELSWWYSEDGLKVIATKHKTPALQGAKKQAGITTYELLSEKMPSLELIYIAHRFRRSCTELNIIYKTGTSTFFYRAEEQTTSWQHQAK